MNKLLVVLFLTLNTYCANFDNYSFEQYSFEDKFNFKITKNYYYFEKDNIEYGLSFVPIEIGQVDFVHENFTPGNEQKRTSVINYVSHGLGPVFRYKYNEDNIVHFENQIMVNSGFYSILFNNMSINYSYTLFQNISLGGTLNHVHNFTTKRDVFDTSEERYEGIDGFKIAVSINTSFKESILTNVFDGFLYFYSTLLFLPPMGGA